MLNDTLMRWDHKGFRGIPAFCQFNSPLIDLNKFRHPLSLNASGREAVIGTERPPNQGNTGTVGEVVTAGRVEDG